ncbi:MAG: transporter substrate-binding domain-containing protein [Proteobacteria bacterium]|nr:transporter substrate-binding domain-containing protein [Pseudomonadota bacterium]
MQSHRPFPRCAWAAAIAAVLLYGGAAAARELSVCIDSSSPTAAMDSHLAQAVAAHEGATLRVHKYDSDDNDEVNGMAHFGKLAGHDCSLVLGFPLDTDAPPTALGTLKATRPYAHTGFVLVTPANSKAAALDQLPHDSKVAVTYMTPPNLYFADHPDLQPNVELHDPETLAALAAGKTNAAMVWYPAVVGYQADHGARFEVHPLQERHARFDLVALYDAGHAPAAAAFDEAIASLHASGELAKLLSPYAEAGGQPEGGDRSAMAERPRTARVEAKPCATKSPTGGAPSSAPPALYTSEQATAGKQKFLDDCSQCHGPNLEGRAGPALKGPNFASAKADFHVRDIFTIVAHNMPATQPGTLPHDEYVAIMAFLLQQNGYPAGPSPLTYDEAMKSDVPLLYRGE